MLDFANNAAILERLDASRKLPLVHLMGATFRYFAFERGAFGFVAVRNATSEVGECTSETGELLPSA